MQSTTATYRYRVDADDRLVWVDAWWLAFAAENGAAELTETAVLGRRLWDYVADDTTSALYHQIHDRVRQSGGPIVLSCRCDSPTLRRQMRLSLTRCEAGQIDYESVLLKAEPVAYLAALDPRADRSKEVLILCSCCKQVLVESTGWLALEEAAARLRLFDQPSGPRLRYAVCPACAKVARKANGNGDVA